jgi:hypothetical protein
MLRVIDGRNPAVPADRCNVSGDYRPRDGTFELRESMWTVLPNGPIASRAKDRRELLRRSRQRSPIRQHQPLYCCNLRGSAGALPFLAIPVRLAPTPPRPVIVICSTDPTIKRTVDTTLIIDWSSEAEPSHFTWTPAALSTASYLGLQSNPSPSSQLGSPSTQPSQSPPPQRHRPDATFQFPPSYIAAPVARQRPMPGQRRFLFWNPIGTDSSFDLRRPAAAADAPG